MALLGKIRNNMWFVFILIALATAAFIFMDAMGPGGGGIGGPDANTPVGEIAGQKIKQNDFSRSTEFLFGNLQDANAKRDLLWDYYVDRGILSSEAEKLGMGIGHDELMDLQFGSNLSPVIRNNFTVNGQLNVSLLQQFKNLFESGDQIAPEQALFWAEQEKQIKKEQLQIKINSLAQKAIYTPNWMAQNAVSEENGTADVAVVRVPFDAIDGSGIEVSNSDISNFIQKNRKDYELKEEMREGTYISYNLTPSAADSAKLRSSLLESMDKFRTASNDSIFTLANNGFYSNGYGKAEQLDEFYSDKVGDFEVGGVYGPYVLGPSYQAVKLIDKKVLPDSVKARHILRNVTAGNAIQLTEANRLIDSLENVLRTNKNKFAELAEEFSQDLSNNTEGGDLGYFVQGRMVKAFNDVCFLTGKEGGLYKVQTNFGVHLIYIEDQVYTDRAPGYKLAYINTPILPGEETQEEAYNVLLNLVNSYPYLSELKAEAEKNRALSIGSTGKLGINGYQIADLGGGDVSRNIAKWMYDRDAEIGAMSQTIYEYANTVTYTPEKYVLVSLDKIHKPGLPSPESVRGEVEFAILNQLKAEKAVSSMSGGLLAVASQYNSRVDTLRGLSMLNNTIAQYGSEPELLGAAFGQDAGSTSQPVIGNSGIYLVQTLSKNPASGDQIAGLSFIKNTIAGGKKNSLQFGLVESLKDHYEVKDNRSLFY